MVVGSGEGVEAGDDRVGAGGGEASFDDDWHVRLARRYERTVEHIAADLRRLAEQVERQVYQDLTKLAADGLVEKVHACDLRRLVPLSDGRVVDLGPEASAVGWRAIAVDDDGLAALEALWATPAASDEGSDR